MAKRPRKPKLLKYPRKPKMTSSASVLDRYLERIKDVDRKNHERMHDYEKELREHESEKKRHAELRRRISGIGKASDGVKRRHSTKKHHTLKHAAKHRTRKRAAKHSARKRRTRR